MGNYNNKNYRTYVLVMLTALYALSFIDRQLIAILQESIKADLGINDTQLGFLSGFAFAVFYVLAGIPVARIADQSNRRNLITVAVGVWSLMTALCGVAQNYIQMLFVRIGVGVGEAGCSPPAHSMISDLYPPEQRASALSFYSIGINIGIMLGFLLGGYLNEAFGWRTAFLVVGLPGILIALLFRFTVAEPVRGLSERRTVDDQAASFTQVLTFIWRDKSLVHICIGGGIATIAFYGLNNWQASFFIRSHGMSTTELGWWLACGVGVFGGLGTFGWGYFCDRFGQRDKRFYMWLPTIAMLIAVPLILVTLLITATKLALMASVLTQLFVVAFLGTSLATFHSAVEPRMRATVSAVYFLVINVVGLGFGTALIGFVSDVLATSYATESLRYSMVFVIPIACVWSAIHFFMASKLMAKKPLVSTSEGMAN